MKLLLLPLLAAVAYAASILLAKVGLTRRRISLRDYIPGLFLWLTVFSGLSLLKWGSVNYQQLLGGHNPLWLGALVLVAVVWNLLFYIGVSREKVNTTEGIIILMPLMTIALSWLFTPELFNPTIAISTVAATLLVAWTYGAHRALGFDRYSFMLLGAVVLMAAENVLAARVLQSGAISPATLYCLRTSLIFVTFYLYYRPALLRLKLKTMIFLAASGLIGATSMLFRFYGLRDAGLTLTAIVLILVPVLVYTAAVTLMHEKIKASQLATMLIVGALILYAIVANYSQLTNS